MGLKKIGKSTAPRSFGTGGAKITPKTSVSNTLNKVQNTYTPSVQKESAFDKLFDLANEVASKATSNVPKFTLPTTASGIVKKSSSINQSPSVSKQEPVGALEWLGKNAAGGLSQFNQAVASTLDFFLPTELIFGEENDPVSRMNNFYQGQANAWAQEAASANERAGGVAGTVGQYVVQPVVNAVPQAILALMSGGASLGAQAGTAGLQAASTAATAGSGLASTIGAASQTLARNPSFWTSVLQTTGPAYDEAKAGGAGDLEATASALITGLLNSAVEIGGGIEALPAGLKNNSAVRQWVKSALEEGREEVVQGAIENLVQKAVYDRDKAYFSMEDQNAIINPIRAAQEFAGGVAVGGILGGGGLIVNSAINRVGQQRGGNTALEQMANEMAAEQVNQITGLAQQTTQASVQTSPVVQTQQQTQAQQPTALLDQLRQQTATLSNRQAEQVLADRQALSTLQQDAGLDLSSQTTIAQRRAAVKQAFEQYASRQQQAQTIQQGTDMMNTLGESGQKAFVSAVRETVDPAGTYQEFSQPYMDGMTGAEPGADLSPAAQAAYYADQNDAAAIRTEAPGFTESEYSGNVSESDRSFYDALGKATGTKISVVAPTGEGGYNGYYQNGEIRVAADAEDPGRVVVAHEATHRLQEIAPEAYTKFRDYAVSAVAGQDGASALISAYQSRYADAGVTLTQEAAMDEIAADYAQRLMIDEAAIRRVVADDRNIAQKFVDTIKDLIEKVKKVFSGKEARSELNRLETARDLWLDALKEGSSSREAAGVSDARYSIKSDKTSSTEDEAALNRLREEKQELEEALDDDYYFETMTAEERKKANNRLFKVNAEIDKYVQKERAASVLTSPQEILDNLSNYRRSDLESLAEQFSDGNWDDYEDLSRADLESALRDAMQERFSDLSPLEMQVRKNGFYVRPVEKFSLKGTSQLQRQVQNLQERNAYLKEQMKRSTSIKTDRKKTTAYAKQLLKSYESQYGADALTSDLLSIYDEFANAGSDVDMDSLTARAREVAGRVLEQSVREDAELYNEYEAMRNYLRTTKINVPKEIHADLDMVGGYNQFRKSNMGRMKLSSSDGAAIDTVYQELAQQYPGLFDESSYTNPADQLINMADVLDGIQPIIENPYSSDMEMATRFVASEILESYFDIPQQKPTFADRQQARVEAARAAGNRRVAELREANQLRIAGIREQNRERISSIRASNQQRIAQLREQGRQQVKAAIQKERTRRAEQIQALKEKYTSKEAAGRERRAAREVRNKIQRHVKAISQKLLSPTDKSNVPEILRKPVAALLDAINLESAYTVDPETGKRTKGGGGDPTKRTAAFMDLRKAYQEIANSADGSMVIDPALLGDQASGFEGNFDKVISLRDKRLSDMSLSELDMVWNTVKAVEHSISTAGKNLAQSKFAGTVEWARTMQAENAGKVQRSSTKRHWTLDLLTPITYFSRFGDSGVEVYRILRNAQDRQQQMITDIEETTREIVSSADARKYRYETHEFVTDGGQELTLTTAQIMSIYELSKRKQAQGHLLSGGIYQPEVPGTKIQRGTEAIHLTEGDLATIVGTLTDKQAKVADDLQKVMATTLADLGNEASMKAYGYKKFTGADYWPISVAREGVKTTVENSGMNTRSISNIGLAKATVPKASNPLNIEDAFTTFTQHAGDMTDYAAYLLPMEDASRLFNFRFKDGEGNYTGQTIKGLLNRVGGAQSDAYWTRLVDDIQNGTAARTDSQFSAGIQDIIGKTKAASVGANLRVVVQQPTAFFRAAAVLSPTDLSRGVAGAPTKGSGWKKALKWAPIAQRKQIGGFEIGNGVRLETELFGDLSKGGKRALNTLDDIASTPAAKADELTWGRIWNACEWQVSKNKTLAKGSDEYYQATANLFTRVIDESQVVDGVLQRSQIMRSNSALNKMATSFMGEPTMSLNMMMRTWDSMRYENDPQKRNAARRKFARAGTALIVSGVINAMVQSLVDAERDKDQDKKYWERVFSAFTGLTGEEETPWDKAIAAVLNSNVSGNINPLGQIPYVKDVLSLLQGYDVTRMDADAVGDFITAGENVVKNIGGDGPRTPAYAAKELVNAGAKVFGISVGNLWRDASGVANAVAVETDNMALLYEMTKAGYNLSNTSNKSRFLDIAFRAWETGDTNTYSTILVDLLLSGTIENSDEFMKAMALRFKETDEFVDGQESTQSKLEAAVTSSKMYKRFDKETQEKAIEKVEDYAYAKQMSYLDPDFKISSAYSLIDKANEGGSIGIPANEDILLDLSSSAIKSSKKNNEDNFELPSFYNWVKKADGGSYVGLTPDEYILFDIASNMLKSDSSENGMSRQEKVIDLLKSMDLSNAERSYLFGTEYESGKNNPWK